MANAKLIVLALFSLVVRTCAQSYLPSFAHLNHLGPGGHARGGGEQAEARARRGTPQLEDIAANVNAVDIAPNDGSGADDSEVSQRLKRHLEIGGKVGGTFKIGFVGHGFGGASEEDDRFKRETSGLFDDTNVNVDAVDNSHEGASVAVAGGQVHRLKRKAHPLRRPRLTRQTSRLFDDINANTDAAGNSRHGTGDQSSEERAERQKRQTDQLRHLEIGGEFGGKLKIGFTGHGHGGDSGNNSRFKREASTRLDDINIDIIAEDNSVHA